MEQLLLKALIEAKRENKDFIFIDELGRRHVIYRCKKRKVPENKKPNIDNIIMYEFGSEGDDANE